MKALLEEPEAEVVVEESTRVEPGAVTPFAVRFAERTPIPKPITKPGEEIFGDPTTVDTTGKYEDPHTDN